MVFAPRVGHPPYQAAIVAPAPTLTRQNSRRVSPQSAGLRSRRRPATQRCGNGGNPCHPGKPDGPSDDGARVAIDDPSFTVRTEVSVTIYYGNGYSTD